MIERNESSERVHSSQRAPEVLDLVNPLHARAELAEELESDDSQREHIHLRYFHTKRRQMASSCRSGAGSSAERARAAAEGWG